MRPFALSIVESVRHPLLVIDADSSVRAANPALYRALQRIPEATIRQPLYAVFAGSEDFASLDSAIGSLTATGVPFEGLEIPHRLPDQSLRHFQFSANNVTSEDDGEVLRLLAFEDITAALSDRKDIERFSAELEQSVGERTRDLGAANRELEAFSYSVSHDLRSPLRAIDGFAAALLRSHAASLDAKGQHYLNRIQVSCQRMASLIDDLLKLSRLTRDKMVPTRFDLSALVEKVGLERAQAEPERHVELVVQAGLRVEGDERLLQIVVENLLSNAWKFTSKGAAARVEFGEREDGGRSAFFVSDNGAGFDMSFADHLFGAFHRLHHEQEFPGTGVGLATVQRVIRRHGGEVWAEGKIGEGATFYFTLPARLELDE